MATAKKRRGKKKSGEELSDEGDFEVFVRSTLLSMNTKIDNVITGQKELTTRLDKLQKTVTNNVQRIDDAEAALQNQDDRIQDLEESEITASANTTSQKEQVSAYEKNVKTIESSINALERYTRSFNLRFLNIPESDEENCREVLSTLLEQHLALPDEGQIENAHRTGMKRESGPRHLIARFHSRVARSHVIRTGRTVTPRPPFIVIDDLSPVDLKEKQRVGPAMKKLYRDGKKPRFHAGKLYAGGRALSETAIAKLLNEAQPEENNDTAEEQTSD